MNRTLLITDDAPIIRELIKDAATAAGWRVVGEATNGQDAIDLYSATQPSVATLDLVMPGFDGLHALRGIKQLDPYARLLVVSALDQSDILREAVQLGASDFIVKPFSQERLIRALDRLEALARSN